MQAAITRLRELGYLDDRKFAEQFAYTLAQNRAFGPQRVRRELKAKLVDYRQIDAALERTFADVNERELLERALEKKVRGLRLPVTHAKLAALCQSLLRRGFRAGDIITAVRARPELKIAADNIEPVELEASGEEPDSEQAKSS